MLPCLLMWKVGMQLPYRFQSGPVRVDKTITKASSGRIGELRQDALYERNEYLSFSVKFFKSRNCNLKRIADMWIQGSLNATLHKTFLGAYIIFPWGWGDLREAVPAYAAFGGDAGSRSHVRQNLFAPLHHKRGRRPVATTEDQPLLVPFNTTTVTTDTPPHIPKSRIVTHGRNGFLDALRTS